MPESASLLTAVETNTRSPHTTGLDTATPATGVFHNTFSLVATFQVTAVGAPAAAPEALWPRNMGQFWADSVADRISGSTAHPVSTALPRRTRSGTFPTVVTGFSLYMSCAVVLRLCLCPPWLTLWRQLRPSLFEQRDDVGELR